MKFGININKLKNFWKSLTVWIAGIFALLTGFIMKNPDYIDLVLKSLNPEWGSFAKNLIIYTISSGGFLGITYGRVRNGKPLERR